MNVIDTNVIIQGFRSKLGASNVIVRCMILGEIEYAISPALILEYEDVLSREGILGNRPAFGTQQVQEILKAIRRNATEVLPWFTFRPFLEADPKDDLVIDCALAANASIIVSDDRHFRDKIVGAFGITVFKAGEFASMFDLQRRLR